MKIRSILAAGLVAASALATHADEYHGQKTMGILTGYTSQNRSANFGIEYTYRFNRIFRLAPNATYVFKHFDRDALILNINGQFIHTPSQGAWELFPYIGLNYTSWNYHTIIYPPGAGPSFTDVNSRVSRLGVNLGAGANINLTEQLQLGLTAGYSFVKDYSTFQLQAKIAYRF